MIQVMNARFNDEDGDRDRAARAASVIVLAVFGVLIPPFGSFLMDHQRLGPGPGSTLLLFVWLSLVIGGSLLVKDRAVPAQIEIEAMLPVELGV